MILGAINSLTKKYTSISDSNKSDMYLCVECNSKVIAKKGEIKAHHYSHTSDTTCKYFCNPGESEYHLAAKFYMKTLLESNIDIIILKECYICKLQSEFLTIFGENINKKIEIEYYFEYKGRKYADVAYLDNDKLLYIFEIYASHKTLSIDRPTNIDWFEIDAYNLLFDTIVDEKIYIFCSRKFCCDKCNIKNNNGVIYFNQLGAGNAKTYSSIKLLNDDDRFNAKNIFIYLTKAHSAKDVIYFELKTQEKDGKLSNLEVLIDQEYGKQYVLQYFNIKLNKEIKIIVGTIDSFTWAISDKSLSNNSPDFFGQILKCIINSKTQVRNNIKYSGMNIELNNKCLILIDECQDLCIDYLLAMNSIIKKTKIDLYLIGDKLQSIWGSNNIFTFFSETNLGTEIYRCEPRNNIYRFHNTQFIDFTNNIIDFEYYKLPKVKEICSIENCKYTHENDLIPYTIFKIPDPSSYDNIDEFDIDNDKLLDKILEYMNAEIEKYSYLPNDFMFIFPILKCNNLAIQLELKIQLFWIDKFSDLVYQTNVLSKNEYWKDRIQDNNFYKYIYLHKSDENKPINLKESENATRILSIHSSKGNGCSVVFVLGITEYILKIFSKEKNNLVYNSLLHVAITRQKKAIYFGITDNNDDIWNRFNKYYKNIIKNDIDIKPSVMSIKTCHRYADVSNYICNNENLFQELFESVIVEGEIEGILSMRNEENKTGLIDWGNHILRYATIEYNFLKNIVENEILENNSKKDQFTTILKLISKKEIYMCENYSLYYKILKEISVNSNKNKIPILNLSNSKNTEYYKYSIILKHIMEHIQIKLINTFSRIGKIKFPKMCPLESIILLFMIEIMNKGKYSEYSIMEIYSLIHCYDMCSKDLTDEHSIVNNCVCKKHFKNNNIVIKNDNSIELSIKNHYDNISKIDDIYSKYIYFIKNNLKITNMTYNYRHLVQHGNERNNFNLISSFVIIGHSDKYVVYFIIKPSLNILNINNIICNEILNNYLLLNSNDNDKDISNNKRYINKEIITCILTFDTIIPIFHKLNITKSNIAIKNCIKSYLFNKYTEYHTIIYEFYQYYKNNGRESSITSPQHVLNKLVATKHKIPIYIENYLRNKHFKIIENNTYYKEILIELNNKELVLNELNIILNKEIDIFLNINNLEYEDI